MTLEDFEPLVKDLIEKDVHDEADRAWLVAIYLSFRIAKELGFEGYAVDSLSLSEQTLPLLTVLAEPLVKTVHSAASETRKPT